MPYEGETASKASHMDLIKNPDIARFLDECEMITPPSEAEAQAACARFVVPPPTDHIRLPAQVIAVDGSCYMAEPYRRQLPSTKVGYIKTGCVLIDMGEFASLRDERTGLVDPFRVSRLERNNDALAFAVPGANVYWGKGTLVESFRARVDALLHGENTRFDPADPATSLRTTLFLLASLRAGGLGTGDPHRLLIHRCPNATCTGSGPVEVRDTSAPQHCPACGIEVYAADCLRLWEEVSDYAVSEEALSRFMLQIEHMLPMHYMRYLLLTSPATLAGLVFFIDGPLAVFGNGAWLHGSIMRYVADVNRELLARGHHPILIIGLQKSGQIVDYISYLDPHLPKNRIYAVDDDYRYRAIKERPAGRATGDDVGFGAETYYGQDFIYKTPSGRVFVFALPYPFASKKETGNFKHAKIETGRYTELARALALIQEFECDLYENAVVPIALAHRYTAISLRPGGRVLELLTRQKLGCVSAGYGCVPRARSTRGTGTAVGSPGWWNRALLALVKRVTLPCGRVIPVGAMIASVLAARATPERAAVYST